MNAPLIIGQSNESVICALVLTSPAWLFIGFLAYGWLKVHGWL